MRNRTDHFVGLAYDCDALLPLAQRNASYKFRRCAQGLDPELPAFLAVVPAKFARWIFGRHLPAKLPPAEPAMVQANMEGLSVDVGLAVLRAMQEGGWKHGAVPVVVGRALAELVHGGMSYGKVADLAGLTRDQVRWVVAERGKRAKQRKNSAFMKILTA